MLVIEMKVMLHMMMASNDDEFHADSTNGNDGYDIFLIYFQHT